ncbi:MAG: hypothetical protein RL150_632 [Candidatus Parcubacteria bacterium]|jgi:hypothetical protein
MNTQKTGMLLLGALVIGLALGYTFGVARADAEKHDMDDGHGHMSMNEMMHDMTAALEDKQGAEFDAVFLEEMIVHHQGAVEMAEMVLTQSDNAQLRAFAEDIIRVQSAEIDQMSTWHAEWTRGEHDFDTPVASDGATSGMHGDMHGGTQGGGSASAPGSGSSVPPSSGDGSWVACTMDAKICPDGSAVGRQGPNCEFAKCPGEN